MDFSNITFKRKFSMTMFKNLRIKMGEMNFTKDFISAYEVTDLYPIISKSDDCEEFIKDNLYHLESGTIERWFCEFFPHASYEITADLLCGKVGFAFKIEEAKAEILFDKNNIFFTCGETTEVRPFDAPTDGVTSMVVTCEPHNFNIYFRVNGELTHFTTFSCPEFADSVRYQAFSNGYAAIKAEGNVAIHKASAYLDNGVSQADMRPIRYENGDIIIENGKIYMTISIRQNVGGYQAIYSWVPGTAEIEMCGAIFFDCGDGRWSGEIASSILFNRKTNEWYIWYVAFGHGHFLGHSKFEGDPRFGINVIDTTLMDRADENSDQHEFLGFPSDEDPDFFYDEKTDKWYMAICRHDNESGRYKYHFFESDKPFEGYKFIGKGVNGSETGGSFVNIKGERHFVCGNGFKITSNYRIYSKDGVQDAKFDYPDGGYRGWGTLMPIKLLGRTRYFWWTFDRHNGGDGNWTYGNIFCFEAEIK